MLNVQYMFMFDILPTTIQILWGKKALERVVNLWHITSAYVNEIRAKVMKKKSKSIRKVKEKVLQFFILIVVLAESEGDEETKSK